MEKHMFKNHPFRLVLLVACMFAAGSMQSAKAQGNHFYTNLQVGGIFGVQAQNADPASGYQFQFMVGRNYFDRTFIGVGLGNNVYRGRAEIRPGETARRRLNTLPLFVDFRRHLVPVSPIGHLSLVVNAGYAPSLGGDYYRGWNGRAGLAYSHMLLGGNDLQFTLSYGLQEFDSRYVQSRFHQHEVHLTVGLFVY